MSDRKPLPQAPLISRKDIIESAELISQKFAKIRGRHPAHLFTINFELIYEDCLYPEYEFDFDDDCDLGCDEDGEQIYGAFEPESNCICVDRSLNNPAELLGRKKTFTIWHEVGHAILHRGWILSQARQRGIKRLTDTELSIEPDVESNLERQANLFAGRAGAPTWFLDYVLSETFSLRTRQLRYTGPGRYGFYVRGFDTQYSISSFAHFCAVAAYHVRDRFGGLSVEALSYRVAESRLVLDLGPKPSKGKPFRFHRSASRRVLSLRVSA